jgi:4,5-DOPA dioxygenase extradiol
MNAIETNPYTEHLKKLGQTLPRPRAIVTLSAHWVTAGTKILKTPWPETIHDFYGFADRSE